MRKRNLTAMAMAAMMIMTNVSPTMIAMAEENETSDTTTVAGAEEGSSGSKIDGSIEVTEATKTIEGDVDVKSSGSEETYFDAVAARNDATLNIKGNVTATNDNDAVDEFSAVTADESKVNVSGDISVKGNGTAVWAVGGSTVEVGGDVSVDPKADSTRKDDNTGVNAQDNSTVLIKGDLTVGTVRDDKIYGSGDGIHADYGSKVTVEGNVTAASSGVSVLENSSVTIGGNLLSGGGDAIYVQGDNAKLIVKGDLGVIPLGDEEKKYGLTIIADGVTDNKSEVAIAGTLKNEYNCLLISVSTDGDGNIPNSPEIVVGTIENVDHMEVAEWKENTKEWLDADEAVAQKVLSSIKYIVNTSSIENGTLSITKLDGSRLDRDRADLYDVAKASEEIKVQIVPVSGYSVKSVSGGKATVTQNSDGSYTVLVPAGGGVDISAILEKIEEQSSQTPAAVVKKTYSAGGGGSSYSSGSMHAVAVTTGAGKTNLVSTPGSWKQNADKSWSFLDSNGETYKNTWIVSNSRWYYVDANGNAVISWVQINGVWYYFAVSESSTNPLGSMLAGTTTPDGYKLDSNGAWVK